MARIRTLKPEFFTSDDITALPPLARLLYQGLWCEADREGRLEWKPTAFKRRYLPDDACDIAELCAALVTAGLVVLYGDGLAYIPTFTKHQNINNKETYSRLPPPPSLSGSDTEKSRGPRVEDASSSRESRVFHAASLPTHSLPTHSQGGPGETAPPGEPAPVATSGALIGRGESVKWQRDQDRLHAAHHPEVCTWRAPGSCRVCLPSAQLAQFADKLVSVAPAERAARVVAWAQAHVPTVAELPANLFRYWDSAWDARHSGDDDGDALHRQTQAFDRRQREIRESLPPVEVNLKALRDGLEAGRASAAAKATGGRS